MKTQQRSTPSSTDPLVRREVVLGVDTHGEVHVAAVVSPLGKILGTESFPATAVGYRQLLNQFGALGGAVTSTTSLALTEIRSELTPCVTRITSSTFEPVRQPRTGSKGRGSRRHGGHHR